MKLALSVEEAAKLVGLGRNATYEAVCRNEIPSVKIGGRILVPRRALEEMFGGYFGETTQTTSGSFAKKPIK